MSKILQIDSFGYPTRWITWKEAATYHSKKLVAWEQGKVETVIRGGVNDRSKKPTVIVTSSILAVKSKFVPKKKHRVPTLTNRALFQRDHYMCAYCGIVLGEKKLSRDHIHPISRGGEDTWMNVVACCSKCNQKKDNKRPEEVGMKLLYVPYVPSNIEYLILKERNILADQMEFLLAFVDEKSPVRHLNGDRRAVALQ